MSSAITPPATMNDEPRLRAARDDERRARHRPAHRHPLEESGRDVAGALPDEVPRRVGGLAVGGGKAGRHRGALDDADEGERERRDEQEHHVLDVRQHRGGQAARHVDDVIEQQHRRRRARRSAARRARSRARPRPRGRASRPASGGTGRSARSPGARRATDAMLHCGMCTSRSNSFVRRLAPCDAKPVKFDSCPRMMFTPTAVRKPVMTAVGTNLHQAAAAEQARDDHHDARS